MEKKEEITAYDAESEEDDLGEFIVLDKCSSIEEKHPEKKGSSHSRSGAGTGLQKKSMIMSQVSKWAYNAQYMFKGQTSSAKISLSNENPVIYLNGLRFTLKPFDMSAELKAILETQPWFTYRSSLEFNGEKINEMGWSCTIRAFQMLLFSFLKKLFGLENKKKDCEDLFRFFMEKNDKNKKSSSQKGKLSDSLDSLGVFSIQNILKTAETKYGAKLGAFFAPLTVSLSVCEILEVSDGLFEPFKLRGICVNSGILYIDKLHAKVFGKESTRIIIEEVFATESEEQKIRELRGMLEESDWNGVQLLFCLDLRFGLEKMDHHMLNAFKLLFKRPFSLGVVGGIKSRGEYFIGCSEIKDEFYFIDPHYTGSSASSKPFTSWAKTFFHSPFEKINPSFCSFFLLKSGRDFACLGEMSEKAKKENGFELFSNSLSSEAL